MFDKQLAKEGVSLMKEKKKELKILSNDAEESIKKTSEIRKRNDKEQEKSQNEAEDWLDLNLSDAVDTQPGEAQPGFDTESPAPEDPEEPEEPEEPGKSEDATTTP